MSTSVHLSWLAGIEPTISPGVSSAVNFITLATETKSVVFLNAKKLRVLLWLDLYTGDVREKLPWDSYIGTRKAM